MERPAPRGPEVRCVRFCPSAGVYQHRQRWRHRWAPPSLAATGRSNAVSIGFFGERAPPSHTRPERISRRRRLADIIARRRRRARPSAKKSPKLDGSRAVLTLPNCMNVDGHGVINRTAGKVFWCLTAKTSIPPTSSAKSGQNDPNPGRIPILAPDQSWNLNSRARGEIASLA